MEPEVRYLILCDEVEVAPANFHRLNVRGLLTHIRSRNRLGFPVLCSHFCVLLLLVECQGQGEIALRIVQGGTGSVIYRNQPRLVRFAGAPKDVVPIAFHLRNCSFPSAGVYWVECLYSGTVIGRQPLTVTA